MQEDEISNFLEAVTNGNTNEFMRVAQKCGYDLIPNEPKSWYVIDASNDYNPRSIRTDDGILVKYLYSDEIIAR